MPHIPVGTFKTTQKMRQLVNQVLDSGIISYGEMSRSFESRFAQAHGSQYGLLSNSGTSALQVGLQAMQEVEKWPSKTQVIVPVTTFVATANIVRHLGLRIVFADVEPTTWNLGRDVIGKITERTRAVIPVHLLGLPADMTGLRGYLRLGRKDVKILEDSCECMFATHYGKPVGSLGDVAAFSTYVAHILVTGVGGLTTTSNPHYAGKIRSLLNHGLQLDQLNPDENFAPQPMRGRRFLFDTYGHSFRLTEMEAALGLAQLDDAPQMIALRQQNAARYRERLSALNQRYGKVFSWQEVPAHSTHAYMMFGIVMGSYQGRYSNNDLPAKQKESLTAHLQSARIETRDIPTILGQKVYPDLDAHAFKVSNWLWRGGFYVGCHQDLTLSDIDYVCDQIEAWLTRKTNK